MFQPREAPEALPWDPAAIVLRLDGDGRLAGHAQAAGQTVSTVPLGTRVLVGDVALLAGRASGGDDVFANPQPNPGNSSLILVGDADRMTGRSRGGDDTIDYVERGASIYGDSALLSGHALGGADTIAGTAQGGMVRGDGAILSDHARGGDDAIAYGAAGGSLTIVGDGELLRDHARGGNDTLEATGPSGGNILIGDGDLADFAKGGDDVLRIESGITGFPNRLVGDGALSGRARGGDDWLEGAARHPLAFLQDGDQLIGDGPVLHDRAAGGNDTLVGSAGDDMMWGDAPEVAETARRGRDLFVVSPGGGADTIGDFIPGEDLLDLRGFADTYDAVADLATAATEAGLVISLADGGSVTLPGVTALAAADVILG